jgi:hypothetical protein
MLTRLRNQIAVVACSLLTASGLTTGLALGCSGNYCNGQVYGCTPLYESVQDSCCKDFDGDGLPHCVQCWRDEYWCPSFMIALGPAYGCSDAGAFCS